MIDPSVQRLLNAAALRTTPPTHAIPAVQARLEASSRRTALQPDPPPVAHCADLSGPVPLRVYRPLGSESEDALPVLVFFHGGGWVLGDLDSHDGLCRALCNLSGCAVVAVDYRLSPEHVFPAALEDAMATLRFLRAHAESLHIDANRLAVGGDSAGANLATVCALLLRDMGDAPPAYQLLIYPMTDLHAAHASYDDFAQGYLVQAETLRYFIRSYLGTRSVAEAGWRASPLHADDLSRLPPALVLTAGFDPLRDEGAAYADRLAEAGNSVVHVAFPRQVHGFITMGRVIPEAAAALSLCASELRRALRGTP